MGNEAKKQAQVRKLEAERIRKGFKEGWLYHRCRERQLGTTLTQLIASGEIIRGKPKNTIKPTNNKDDLKFFQLVKKELAPGLPLEFPNLEILPDRVHHQNIRNLIYKKDWQRLRKACFWSANYACQSCGYKRKDESEPSFHCHEVWRYDDNTRKQILTELQCLCKDCHHIKHINFIGSSIDEISKKRPFEKFCELSGYKRTEAKEYIERQIELADYRDRPQQDKSDWELDVSIILRVGITPTPQVMNQGVDIPAMRAKREKYRNKPKPDTFEMRPLRPQLDVVRTEEQTELEFGIATYIHYVLLLGAVALLARLVL